jgi:release factor glutamine methyltransferase
MTTAAEALRASPLPEREKRALLAHALGVAREYLLAHPEAPLAPRALERYARMAQARAAGVPLAYLVGVQEFYGLPMQVTPAVLIPRPDTELLVERALAALPQDAPARVLELGTGSGCVAIALALARPAWQVLATDRSVAALEVARENGRRLGATVHWLAGDWYAPLHGRFDLIVSNPPYVAAADPHLAELAHEPREALTDGGDGLAALRHIVAGAAAHLQRGGQLLLEHGHDQGAAVRALLQAKSYVGIETFRDLAGHERVGAGRLD